MDNIYLCNCLENTCSCANVWIIFICANDWIIFICANVWIIPRAVQIIFFCVNVWIIFICANVWILLICANVWIIPGAVVQDWYLCEPGHLQLRLQVPQHLYHQWGGLGSLSILLCKAYTLFLILFSLSIQYLHICTAPHFCPCNIKDLLHFFG